MGHDLAALRAADIELLQYFGIKTICDLMVEDKKKVYVLSIGSGTAKITKIALTQRMGSLRVDSDEFGESGPRTKVPRLQCIVNALSRMRVLSEISRQRSQCNAARVPMG